MDMYTVAEVSKKLRVRKSFVYELYIQNVSKP